MERSALDLFFPQVFFFSLSSFETFYISLLSCLDISPFFSRVCEYFLLNQGGPYMKINAHIYKGPTIGRRSIDISFFFFFVVYCFLFSAFFSSWVMYALAFDLDMIHDLMVSSYMCIVYT